MSDRCIILSGDDVLKHEVTSLNTKKLLASSLKKLMEHKTFSKISVTEIINDCGLNRKTFYYHFEDVQALLKWMLEQETFEMIRNFDLVLDSEEALEFMLDYVEDNKHILNCVYDSIGRDELKRFFFNDFKDITMKLIDEVELRLGIRADADYKTFLCDFYTNAVTGQLIEVLRTRKAFDKEQLIRYLINTIKVTLPTALEQSQI